MSSNNLNRKNIDKGFVNIVLIGILAALLGIGGYFAWDKKEKTEPLTAETPQADISDWKMYSNSEYGFSFQYPGNYVIGENVGGLYIPVQTYFNNMGEAKIIITVDMPGDSYPANTDFDGAFFSVSSNDNFSLQYCQDPDQDMVSDKPEIKTKIINGITFYSGEFTGAAAGHQSLNRFYNTYRNGKCYQLIEGLRTGGYGAVDSITTLVDSKDVFSKLDKILNTFKFTK